MSPEPSATWITTDSTVEGTVVRGIALAFFVIAIVVLGIGGRSLLLEHKRNFVRALLRAFGRETPAEWVSTDWLCRSCRSINPHASSRCVRCHGERATWELVVDVAQILPGSIAALIKGTDKFVALEHNRQAHRDGLASHWRLRLNGVVFGSAPLRDGALALLRSVEGTDRAYFDPDGAGMRPYRLSDLIALFERPIFPVSESCPENQPKGRSPFR